MRLSPPLIYFALALPLGAGCSFLKPRSDPTRYFVLSSGEPKATVPGAPVVVGVDHVELPEYLLRPELVTRSASNQLTLAEYDLWGEPLKDGFARTFRRDLENELGADHVVAAPFDPAARPALTVDVAVRRFERVADQGAVLEANWTLREAKSGTTVVSRDVRERRPVSGNDPHATVAALSSALAALAGEIAVVVRARKSSSRDRDRRRYKDGELNAPRESLPPDDGRLDNRLCRAGRAPARRRRRRRWPRSHELRRRPFRSRAV
jgi:uncharacterized lipoprotein YmbA